MFVFFDVQQTNVIDIRGGPTSMWDSSVDSHVHKTGLLDVI